MIYQDRIYGKIEIEEPILLELINSQALQRLKGLAQYGLPDKLYPFPGFSRFEHSLGVMLLLKKLKAGFEEQIAGLVHDVSHTAFSHVIDWVWGDPTTEDYQDKNHFKALMRSSAKDILLNHGFSVERIANLSNFSLLDKEIPFLCVDRLDYALREFKLWARPNIVDKCLSSLSVIDNKIVFKDKNIAKEFAETYLSKLQKEHWGGFEAVSRYYRLSEILKKSLERNIITKDDFLNDDMFVLNKIYKSKQEDLINQLKELEKNNSSKIGLVKQKKLRYIDPEVLIEGEIKLLSLVNQEFAEFLMTQKTINEQVIEI